MKEITPNPDTFKEQLPERASQIILGAAVGDTLGMPIEGWTPELISKYLTGVDLPLSGPETQRIVRANPDFSLLDFPDGKFLNRQMGKGEWTDDTALLLAVAQGLIDGNGFNLDAVAKAHVDLYKSIQDIDPDGGWGAYGKTTLMAMKRLAEGADPRQSGVDEKWAQGNGPALKTAPIGILAYKTGLYEEGLEFAYDVGAMTHKNPASIASGIVQAHAVYALLEGNNKSNFLKECALVARAEEDDREEGGEYLAPKLEFIAENPEMSDEDAYNALGNRFRVTENYPFALFMFSKYWDSPVEGMLAAVRMGGDADSIGAIYGSLAGARGVKFPADWTDILQDKEMLMNTSDALVRFNL